MPLIGLWVLGPSLHVQGLLADDLAALPRLLGVISRLGQYDSIGICVASLLTALLISGDASPYVEVALGLRVLLLVEVSAAQPASPMSPR